MAVKFRPDWGQDLWASMVPKSPEHAAKVDAAVDKMLQSKSRYQLIQNLTGVPWFWLAATHWRESSGNFAGIMHNGQRIIGTGKKTTIVPKGRGPFFSWEESAIDAMRFMGLDKIDDPEDEDIEWTLQRILYEWERYNGFGYLNKVNSPYVWSHSKHYDKGKYVRDGVFDPNHVDKQIGAAMILQRMMRKDEEVGEYILSGATKPPEGPDISGLEALELLQNNFEALLNRRVEITIKEKLT